MRHAKKFIIIFFVSMAVLGILGAFSANTYMNVIRKSTKEYDNKNNKQCP